MCFECRLEKIEVETGHPQTQVANQLMVFSKHEETEGNGASGPNQNNMLGIGKSLSDVFHRRVASPIFSLRDVCHTWPHAEERCEPAKLREIKIDFPNCVRIANRALSPLAFEPRVVDARDCSGRKHEIANTTNTT